MVPAESHLNRDVTVQSLSECEFCFANHSVRISSSRLIESKKRQAEGKSAHLTVMGQQCRWTGAKHDQTSFSAHSCNKIRPSATRTGCSSSNLLVKLFGAAYQVYGRCLDIENEVLWKSLEWPLQRFRSKALLDPDQKIWDANKIWRMYLKGSH